MLKSALAMILATIIIIVLNRAFDVPAHFAVSVMTFYYVLDLHIRPKP